MPLSAAAAATPASSILYNQPLTVLHTSDWHLGRRLYGRLRYEEFETFLSWLEDMIATQKVDVLIVAGDIFDTMTPSNKAQALYYEFLGKVSTSCCQHIVIVAGNHDSPTFLDAPSQVLKFLNVHVIGTACDDLSDEVLVLEDDDDKPQCIVAAVPYLRDRDVRSSRAGESADSKDANVIKGIHAHYNEVANIAKSHQRALITRHQRHIPIIATGHLFAANSRTTEDDGVRELYVGNLGKISADMFDDCFDYVALGHLHVPQRVGGREHIRYSGSPIAMGFGEARQQKQVLLVKFGIALEDFDNKVLVAKDTPQTPISPLLNPSVSTNKVVKKSSELVAKNTGFMDDLFGFDEPINSVEDDKSQHDTKQADYIKIAEQSPSLSVSPSFPDSKLLHFNSTNNMQVISLPIPCFQKLAQVSGDLATIADTIKSMVQTESIWLEVIYTGDEIVSELKEQVNAIVENSAFEVLKNKNASAYNKVLYQKQSSETLQDLDEKDVFERCLTVHDINEGQKESLRDAYQQILHNIYHNDSRAE